MKKIIILCLCLFITGCSAESNEKVVSNENSLFSWTSLDAKEYYPLRLEALKQGEFEEVQIVFDSKDGSYAEEITVTDPNELKKIEDFIDQLTWTDEIGYQGPGHRMSEFEIQVKNKGIIRLRFGSYSSGGYDSLCVGQSCYILETSESVEEMIDGLNGSVQETKPLSLLSDFISMDSYADTDVNIDLSQIQIKSSQTTSSPLIRDIWYSTNDSLKDTLRIFNYIHEDFTDYTEIQDQALLVSGLIQQSDRYACYDMEAGYCRHEESGDIMVFPNLSGNLSLGATAVPYESVLETGKRLFGEDFTMPNFDDLGISRNYQIYQWLSEQQLFMYHLPYEVMFWSGDGLIILEQETLADEVHVKLIKTYLKSEPENTRLVGYDGYQVSVDNIDSIAEHQDHFEQWEAVLKKTETGYQVLSGKCLNPYETSYEADPTKPVVYRDEENDVQVNLSSVDALHFNRWVKNQENVTYKENIHENLLTVYVNGEDQFAVVFDLATNKALSPMEVKEYLQIDEEKLSAAYRAIPDVTYYNSLEHYHDPLLDLQTTNLFIDSHGNPAMIQNNQVYLFTWEEVR